MSGWGWLGDGVGDLRELGGVALVAAVAGDGGGPGVLAAHLAPNLRRARDRVHLARVARARGVRGLQRAGGTLRHLLQGQKLYLGFIIPKSKLTICILFSNLSNMLHLSKAREPRAPPSPFVIIFLIDVNEKKNKT